jgi:cytochrome c oxidase cbb3-type subunit 4
MHYETLAKFVQQGATLYFFLIFLAGCAYALWPRNKTAFKEAARIPLEEGPLETEQ